MATSEHHHHIAIRPAIPADADGLEHLSELDGRRLPKGQALIGEIEGQLVAAVPLGEGTAIANPFVATGELVDLLRLRARQISPPLSARERALARLATASGKPIRNARNRLHRFLERPDVAVQHLD
jgi:hypothetical protein